MTHSLFCVSFGSLLDEFYACISNMAYTSRFFLLQQQQQKNTRRNTKSTIKSKPIHIWYCSIGTCSYTVQSQNSIMKYICVSFLWSSRLPKYFSIHVYLEMYLTPYFNFIRETDHIIISVHLRFNIVWQNRWIFFSFPLMNLNGEP